MLKSFLPSHQQRQLGQPLLKRYQMRFIPSIPFPKIEEEKSTNLSKNLSDWLVQVVNVGSAGIYASRFIFFLKNIFIKLS